MIVIMIMTMIMIIDYEYDYDYDYDYDYYEHFPERFAATAGECSDGVSGAMYMRTTTSEARQEQPRSCSLFCLCSRSVGFPL